MTPKPVRDRGYANRYKPIEIRDRPFPIDWPVSTSELPSPPDNPRDGIPGAKVYKFHGH